MVSFRSLILKTILTASIILLMVGSLTPSSGMGGPSMNDKILHFVAYAIVGIIAMFAVASPSHRILFLLSLTLLGVALEFGQLFVPGRAFEFWDMAANGCGTFAAFAAVRNLPGA